MRYMLDTNMCIYIIKQKPVDVLRRFEQMDLSDVCLSSLTLSELWYGVAKSAKPDQNKLALLQFIAPLDILSYDADASYHYGLIRSYLEKRGTPIGSLDMLIAAHAMAMGCILVTNNEKEFSRIPDLTIENWVSQ